MNQVVDFLRSRASIGRRVKPVEGDHQHIGKAQEINFLGEVPRNFALGAAPFTRRRHRRRQATAPIPHPSSTSSSSSAGAGADLMRADDLAAEIRPEALLDAEPRVVVSIRNRQRQTLELLVSKTHRAAS